MSRVATLPADVDRRGEPPADGRGPPRPRAPRPKRARSALLAGGEPMIWLTGGSLVVCAVMVLGLLALVFAFGLATFWPLDIVKFVLSDGGVAMGEVTRAEEFRLDEAGLARLPAEARARAGEEMERHEGWLERRLVRTGNYRLTQTHFQWVPNCMVQATTRPEWALVMERLEWGRFYGFPEAFGLVASFIRPEDRESNLKSVAAKASEAERLAAGMAPKYGGEFQLLAEVAGQGLSFLPFTEAARAEDVLAVVEVAAGPERAFALFREYHGEVRDLWQERRDLEKHETGDVNAAQEEARLAVKAAELEAAGAAERSGRASQAHRAALEDVRRAEEVYAETVARAAAEFSEIRGRIDKINEQNGRYLIAMTTAGEGSMAPQRTLMRLDDIVRAYPANRLSFADKIRVYLDRWWEFLSDEPREANSEGGVFPAIFGTVLMTMMMALAVVPFGVLAALYLREYAKAGPVVSAVRIAVNNLAGVPSIVFGVFGLGFFCYGVGSYIDGGPRFTLPQPGWFVLLTGTALAAAGAFFAFIKSVTRPGTRVTRSKRILRVISVALWILSTGAFLVLVATTPFFEGFYRERLPDPTFGKGALIWASLTLALLTLPVVIVATEEALAAVPNSMREGSYACGASKWQTIRRIVLPRAMPGIMTGMILAMARGAGEVAPLMLVGAVKLAPELPFDWTPPFGLNQRFMHLGFHIYDVGFQSQNSEAAKPIVFTTTLLLIGIVAALNVFAIWLRSRLRRRFVEAQF